MAKKRGLNDSGNEKGNKKRSPIGSSSITDLKQPRNILNDGLLSLYKKNESEKADNATDIEVKPKENSFETTKTPAKSAKRKTIITPKLSTINFSNVGGMNKILWEILQMFLHYKLPSLDEDSSSMERGILLHGPSGCGKSLLARAIAGQLKVPIIEVSGPEMVCGISGESESKIRDIFDGALACGRCIVFVDQIDAVFPKRELTDSNMSKRMVSQMITCFDNLYVKDESANVMVIGATNQPDSLDSALRSRFENDVAIGIPNEQSRLKILQVICKKVNLNSDADLQWIAHNTPGYVGKDLLKLINKAKKTAKKRLFKQLVNPKNILSNSSGGDVELSASAVDYDQLLENAISWFESSPHFEVEPTRQVSMEDIQAALKVCVPSSKTEGFASVPDTTWDDIGALDDIKEELRETIMWPVKYSKFFEEKNLTSAKGVLLYGPKGCGKTLLAKAIANECSINFLSVSGPELLSMYVGESEKAVRKVFERARNSAPCVIFFDEFDALCPPRSTSKDNAPIERVVNQLLTEACGVQDRQQVFLVAATNRLDKIDSAMLRPGRLDKVIYVGLPTLAGRVEILKTLTKNKTCPEIDDDLDLQTIAQDPRCENFSGADLAYLVQQSVSIAMKEKISMPAPLDPFILHKEHFVKAFESVKASFTEQDRRYFERTRLHCTRL